VRIGESNNNVDLARHQDRLWMAWRTAPFHFASTDAAIHVVSTGDPRGRLGWRHEHTVQAGRDVREPRLVSWRGRFLLYWFTAGRSGLRFEPDRIWVSELEGGAWSDPIAISPPDCVVWRVRPLGDRLAMTLYRGAGQLFTTHPIPLTVELWGSDDGLAWDPWDPDHPVIHQGGSETDFLELADGSVLAVVRKEGPDGGWGADVCRSLPTEPAAGSPPPFTWRTRPDPRKFDSPFLFAHEHQPWLITRRHLAFRGGFDLGLSPLGRSKFGLGTRTKINQLAYWLTPKRTAVYAIDPESLRATWCTDLPSAGDTAFAAGVPLPDGRGQLVVNYSSPTQHGHWPWLVGQRNPTHIYAVELTFPSDPSDPPDPSAG